MNHDARMWKKILYRTRSFSGFLVLELMVLIQTPSLKSQQDNGTIILAWIALEPSFQYLSFFTKNAKVVMMFLRSWEVLITRVSMYIYVWVIRVEKLIQRTFVLMKRYLIFMAYIFQSFSCKFASNHVQLPRLFPNLIMHEILSVFHA